jgi:hypothetical protein
VEAAGIEPAASTPRAGLAESPRCALLEGFSLHANTHLHANDRQGLERLCRYGARGALALDAAIIHASNLWGLQRF